MGRKSTKHNKSRYQICREDAGYTREAASIKLHTSQNRIAKIESGETCPIPEDILAMSKAYNHPDLCNYYCSNICAIGQEFVPEVECKELSQITLEMLAALNTLSKQKERFIEIVVDGKIAEDEINEFKKIQDDLEKMSLTIETLKLWVQNTIVSGKIDKKLLISPKK